MNKKYLIIGSLAALGIALLITILLSQGKQTLNLSKPVAQNFRYAQLQSSGNARFFNGSAFMEFDFSNQAAKPLTPSYALPNVMDVRWGKDAAIFKATGYGGADQLKPLLLKSKASVNNAYWWAVDFKTGNISPVGTLETNFIDGSIVKDAIWDKSGKKIYYIQTPTFPDSEHITTLYSGAPGTVGMPIGTTSATTLEWGNDSKVIYETDSPSDKSLNEINIESKKARTIKKPFVGNISINPTGTEGVYIDSSGAQEFEAFNEKGPLTKINLSSGKIKVIDKSFTGSVLWSDDENAWAAIQAMSDGSITGYIQNTDGRLKKTSFKPTKTNKPDGLRVFGLADGTVLLLDTPNIAYLAAKSLPKFKDQAPTNSDQPQYNGADTLINQGLTKAQMDGLKVAVKRYSATTKQSVTEVTIDTTSIVKAPFNRDAEPPIETLNFNITIGSSPAVKAKLDYYDLTGLRLYLTNPQTGAALFDSGPIDITAP